MDYNLIKPFLAVFHHSSYTLAANELDVSQPAISQSIKRLEQSLNKTLFIKQGRGIVATSYAKQLANQLREPFENIDSAFLQPEKFSIYSQEHYVYPLLDLNEIDLIESPISEAKIFEDLRNQKIELVLDFCPVTDHSFISEAIDDRLVIIASKDHPRIQGEITEQQYYQESHVTVINKRLGVDIFTLLAADPKPRKILYTGNSIMSLLIFVSNSEGLCISTERASKLLAEKLNLQLLTPPMQVNMTPFSMIYHKRNLHNERHQAMRQKIMSLLRVPR